MENMIMKKFSFILGLILCCTFAQAQEVNMDNYIHLKITPGTTLYFNVLCLKNHTPVKVVNGDRDTIMYFDYIYGGGSKKSLNENNKSYKFDIAKSEEELTDFYLYGDIAYFRCFEQPNVKEINIEHDSVLEWLIIANTSIKSLDISKNQNLWMLQCYNNQLTSLDISNNPKLRALYVYGNKFTAETIDQIMCSFTDRTDKGDSFSEYLNTSEDLGQGIFNVVYGVYDPNYDTFLKTNVQNALDKNWVMVTTSSKKWPMEIPATGTYDCNSGIESVAEQMELNVYPNPATDVLNISCNEKIKSISLTNILGQQLYYQKINQSNAQINTSKLTNGNYILKIETSDNVLIKNIVID